ncbi:MAG: peptidoglycan-binding protein [Clostridia bacterium]|nr:peptidoglycan-binding protein [Clostridia bacterium]
MKKQTKLIILAVIAALCLLLAGCHNSTDETNNNYQGTSGQFATVPPAQPQVIFPDTTDVSQPPAETPESEPTDYTESTPGSDQTFTDDSNGWIDLTSAVTPQPVGSEATPVPDYFNTAGPIITTTSPTSTPVPADAPSPTPKSLQKGFTDSDAVREVQKRLKELGYYKGSADGDFGPATEKAVIAFQKDHGLTADGKVGEKTLSKLNSANTSSKQSSSSSSSNESKATAVPKVSENTYLEHGKSGKQVKTMQNRLIELGWLSGSASGTYDDATEAAVIAFQKKAKLWADGKAGPKTLEALYSSKAPSSSKPASGSGETLERGSTGSEVKKLQNRLKDLGYLDGSVDGDFGEKTETAVIDFQQNNGLTADGKAGTATQNKLYSDTAKKKSAASEDYID